MELDLNKFNDIKFSSSRNDEFLKQLNGALKALVENDKRFVSTSSSAPKLWECKWLNQQNVRGYSKGDAVWVNSNSYDQIVSFQNDSLVSYVTNNIILGQMYSSINKDDADAVHKFLVKAANGTASPNVSAIYYLGDITKRIQIRISSKDDNKDYPSCDSWHDFYSSTSYDENVDLMLSVTQMFASSAFAEHTSLYHLTSINNADMIVNGYFKKSPFDPQDVQLQSFFDHNYCNEMHGFDYVKRWKVSDDGNTWCRVWNSGYIEQGGFVDNIPGEELLPVRFMTTYNYPVGASFYQRDYKTYNGSYQVDSPIQANNRYIAVVTPLIDDDHDPYPESPIDIGGELVYSSVDVTNMSNSGFAIVNVDAAVEHYVKYSWYACGYKILTKDSQMFDAKLPKTAVGSGSFVIDGKTVVGFNDNGYTIAVVPDGMTSIGSNAFNGYSKMQSFVLPDSLENIGEKAFYGCSSMKGIVIPSNVTEIGNEAFSNCPSLAYANIGKNVKNVGTKAFYSDYSLANVTRFNDTNPGHTFDMVGDYAFAGTALKKANLSLRSSSIYTFWGDYCFAQTPLEEVNILSSCYMSTGMFQGCTQLTAVNFKNNYVSYVYPNVFDGCTALSSITLPSKIWYISEEMFKNCTALQNVKFTSYIESPMTNLVQRNAFNGCSNMKTLQLPASITSTTQLDDACLCGCALTGIAFHGIAKDTLIKSGSTLIDDIATTGFKRLNHNCTISCMDGTLQFTYDASKIKAYVAPNNFMETRIDKTTTSNFQTPSQITNEGASKSGKRWWYYNAKQLKEQADRDHTPCVFIYSLLGCDPCQIYASQLFNNTAFQNYASKQKFYMCQLEVTKQPYYDQQLAFCVDELTPYSSNFIREDEGSNIAEPNLLDETFKRYKTDSGLNSNLYTPVIIFYHNKGEGNVTYVAYSFHNISKYIAALGSVTNLIRWFYSLCLYYFDNNEANQSDRHYVVNYSDDYVISPYDVEKYKELLTGTPEANPYEDPTYVINPKESSSSTTALQTVAEVNKDMRDKLRGYIDDKAIAGNSIYIAGCAIDRIGYIADTYPGLSECESIKAMNDIIQSNDYKNYKFKIGDRFYTLSFSESDTMMIRNTCGADGSEIKAGAVIWTALQ